MRFPTMWYVRPAKSQASLHISICLSLGYSLTVKLLTKHRLEFLSLKGGCTGSSESTLDKVILLTLITVRLLCSYLSSLREDKPLLK